MYRRDDVSTRAALPTVLPPPGKVEWERSTEGVPLREELWHGGNKVGFHTFSEL